MTLAMSLEGNVCVCVCLWLGQIKNPDLTSAHCETRWFTEYEATIKNYIFPPVVLLEIVVFMICVSRSLVAVALFSHAMKSWVLSRELTIRANLWLCATTDV